MKHRFARSPWVIFVLLAPLWIRAQDSIVKHPIKINGQFGSTTDHVFGKAQKDSNIIQLPQWMQRFNGNINITWRKFQLPINFAIMVCPNCSSSYHSDNMDLKSILHNPRNQFRLQPTIGKNKFILGNHVLQISPLTAGNTPFLMGVGYERNGKKWFAKASSGVTAWKSTPSETNVTRLERRMIGGTFGLGNLKKSYIALAYLRAWDVRNRAWDSIVPPKDGAVMSLQTRISIFQTFYWKSEFAFSSNNANALGEMEPSEGMVNAFGDIFTEKTANGVLKIMGLIMPMGKQISMGLAANEEIGFSRKQWGLAVGLIALSPAYRSIAYYSQLTDYADLTARGNFRSKNGKLQFDGTAGLRRTNLLQVMTENNQRRIANGNISLQPTKWLFLSGSYANFGVRQLQMDANSQLDTIKQINQSFGVNASIILGKQQNHSLSLSLMNDKYENLNDSTGTSTQSAGITYQFTMPKNTTLSLGGNAFKTVMDTIDFAQYNITAGVQQALLKRRLQLATQLQYGITADGSGQNMKGVTASVAYKPTKHLQLTLRGNTRTYGKFYSQKQTRLNLAIRYNF
jgi:hypothetical protein